MNRKQRKQATKETGTKTKENRRKEKREPRNGGMTRKSGKGEIVLKKYKDEEIR